MRPTPVVTKAYAPQLAPPATSATVSVLLPADADLWFQGMKIPQAGTLRRFNTPELNPLLSYSYDVQATWLAEGRWVSQSQRMLVRAGDHLTLSFPNTQTTPAAPPIPTPRTPSTPPAVPPSVQVPYTMPAPAPTAPQPLVVPRSVPHSDLNPYVPTHESVPVVPSKPAPAVEVPTAPILPPVTPAPAVKPAPQTETVPAPEPNSRSSSR
jgi:uncharacterized protein (TIGR03000 family)